MEAAAIAALVIGAFLFTRISGLVLRRLIRRMAERGAEGRPSRWWRAAVRYGGTDRTETGVVRRRQRVDAAARMLNHLVTVVVWIVVTIAIFQILDVDAAFFLSSLGFIGAGFAIGGQHKVNDYLTGLEVLFEDRYGVGDDLIVEQVGREPLHAVVDHVGLFSTRLRDETSTLHVPNGSLQLVRNLSQQATTETVRLHVGNDPDFDLVSERSVAKTVRDLGGPENLTEVIFVGDLDAQRREDGDIEVEVKTTRPLDPRSKDVLQAKAEDTLRGQR